MLTSATMSLLLIVAGCTPAPVAPTAWIAPLDGRTALAPDAELRLHAPALHLPPDYPLGDFLRVVDLADGGFVPGEVVPEGDQVRFVPAEPWDGRYVWTVDQPAAVPHGPELPLPSDLLGSAVFDTSGHVELLAATADDGLCLVLSRALDEPPSPVRITLDDVDLVEPVLALLDRDAWMDALPEGLRPEVDLACVEGETAEPGARLRVWFGEEGPFTAEVEDLAPADLVLALHRGRP